MKELISKILEALKLIEPLKATAAYKSFCSILKISDYQYDEISLRVKTKPKTLKDYVSLLDAIEQEKLIQKLMAGDPEFKDLNETSRQRRARLVASENSVKFITEKTKQLALKNKNEAEVILGVKIIPGTRIKLVKEFSLEEYLATKTEKEIDFISKEINQIIARIKDPETVYNSEFSIAHGLAAREVAERMGFEMVAPEDFISHDVKKRDWAIKRIAEQLVERIEELAEKAIAKGLSPDAIIARRLSNG